MGPWSAVSHICSRDGVNWRREIHRICGRDGPLGYRISDDSGLFQGLPSLPVHSSSYFRRFCADALKSQTQTLTLFPLCNMLVSLLAAVFGTVATAKHPITLRNNCNFAVRATLSNFPHNGVSYTGPAIPEIPAKSSHQISVPKGWNGRICHSPPKSGAHLCISVAFGEKPCSMTEIWDVPAAPRFFATAHDKHYAHTCWVRPPL
ncbi:hypothetical protein K438DRAFT_1766747 [Mycena galopus ATCC 62051]|nr:hypothetical protein K438DRAFT_1766747 [Mycena galopus ATCC 62051]